VCPESKKQMKKNKDKGSRVTDLSKLSPEKQVAYAQGFVEADEQNAVIHEERRQFFHYIQISAQCAVAAINNGANDDALAWLGGITKLATTLDATTAKEILANLDHNALGKLTEMAPPDTRVGKSVDAELARRGLQREWM
jgi:hypothetical protein